MNDLRDTFEQLDPRPARGAGPVLAAARTSAGRMRRRRRLVIGLGAATVVALTTLGIGTLGDDGGPTVTSDSGPPATSSTSTTDPPATQGAARDVAVDVYFSPAFTGDCSATVAVPRTVRGPAVLSLALRALLAGPTPEERADGLTSFFSDETAGALRSVKIVDGTAFIDFEDFSSIIGNASTSCGSGIFGSQLERTVLQFPTVQRILYSFDGDVEAFYYWLQGTPPDYYSPSLPGWTKSVGVDAETGELHAPGFNGLLEAERPTWAQDPRSVATVLLHLDDRAEGEVVDLRQLPDPGGRIIMAVEISDLADDSVASIRYEIVFRYDEDGQLLRFQSGTRSQRCQPGRGHEDARPDPCV